jgi:hypothetical protein
MATVYIFDNQQHTGHAALGLDEGKYISFHPQGPSKLGPVYRSYEGAFSDSLEDDLPNYDLTERVDLSGLDEEAMAGTYERMKGHTQYRFYSMNCSTVVAKLLIIGAGEAIIGSQLDVVAWRLRDHAQQFFSNRDPHVHGRLTERAIGIMESAVKGAVRAMHAESRNGGRVRRSPILPAVTGATVVADVVARDFVWNPGEVLRFAEYIKEHLR